MTISVSTMAETMEDVIPHLLNPAATNRPRVRLEYRPI